MTAPFMTKVEGVAVSGTPRDPDPSGLEVGEVQQAAQVVQAVVARYAMRIPTERKAPLPVEERIAQLMAHWL